MASERAGALGSGMTRDADSVLETAEAWLNDGQRVAWATVVGTWRSSLRPVGSQMVIAGDGRFAGSVSGGCVEGAVIEAAGALLSGAPATILAYGVSSESAWEVGLPCGGKIEIFLAELQRPMLESLLAARRSRSTLACLTDLNSRTQELWQPGASSSLLGAHEQLLARVADAFRAEQSELIELAGQRVFAGLVSSPLRLVMVGAVHLSQVLAQLAVPFGFELIVVDPRSAFATPERFPSVRLLQDWPDEALAAIGLDRRTAVVVLSHDAKIDEPALSAALRSDCFYVGALGSRRTQEARRRRLADEGLSPTALDRLHGPIGLDIGALTTPEIAVSILAELISVRRSAAARSVAALPPG
jgi:xanthine dehydrogenase accessory factor